MVRSWKKRMRSEARKSLIFYPIQGLFFIALGFFNIIELRLLLKTHDICFNFARVRCTFSMEIGPTSHGQLTNLEGIFSVVSFIRYCLHQVWNHLPRFVGVYFRYVIAIDFLDLQIYNDFDIDLFWG